VAAWRKLGDLHCDFDNAEPYPVIIAEADALRISRQHAAAKEVGGLPDWKAAPLDSIYPMIRS